MACKLRIAIGALTLAASAGLTPAASAQEPLRPAPIPAPSPHPFGQVRVGVLSFAPTIRFTNVGVDTNVFNHEGTERQASDVTAGTWVFRSASTMPASRAGTFCLSARP